MSGDIQGAGEWAERASGPGRAAPCARALFRECDASSRGVRDPAYSAVHLPSVEGGLAEAATGLTGSAFRATESVAPRVIPRGQRPHLQQTDADSSVGGGLAEAVTGLTGPAFRATESVAPRVIPRGQRPHLQQTDADSSVGGGLAETATGRSSPASVSGGGCASACPAGSATPPPTEMASRKKEDEATPGAPARGCPAGAAANLACGGWGQGLRVGLGLIFGLLAGGRLMHAAPEAKPGLDGPGGPSVVLILGAPGEAEYAQALQRQEERWTQVVKRAEGRLAVIGGTASTPERTTDGERVQQVLGEQVQASAGPTPLWVVFVGHGSFDGKEAKFNLRGPDLTPEQLSAWLAPALRPVAVVVASSGSAPFLAKLARPGRVVIVATRSGYELNYARFGEYFADSVADPEADLDRDGQTSLLESFLRASHRTAEFYRNEGRLLSEHALIDDTGDGLGTPAEWFRGTRAIKQAKDGAALDGLRAHQWHLVPSGPERSLTPAQRERRDALEQEIERLRQKKSTLPAVEYERQLEALLLEVARMYEGLPPAGSE